MTRDHLAEYRAQVVAHSAPLRGTDTWVAWVSTAADRLREIAVEEAAHDPAGLSFVALLEDESSNVRTWAAHHLLELFDKRSLPVEQRALNIIEAAARGDSATALGERMWLEEWRRGHQAG
jgi:HEAT repeat protein